LAGKGRGHRGRPAIFGKKGFPGMAGRYEKRAPCRKQNALVSARGGGGGSQLYHSIY